MIKNKVFQCFVHSQFCFLKVFFPSKTLQKNKPVRPGNRPSVPEIGVRPSRPARPVQGTSTKSKTIQEHV